MERKAPNLLSCHSFFRLMRAILSPLRPPLSPRTFPAPLMQARLAAFFLFALAPVALPQVAPVPDNLGLGLRQLVESSRSDPAQLQTRAMSAPSINADVAGRVLVNVQLNGEVAFAEMQTRLADIGAEITAADPNWRNGVISAWVPLAGAEAAASLPGVRSIALARKPIRRVGVATAQSSIVER